MPFDPVEVAKAQAGGLSAVCSLCKRYWEGRAKGLVGCGVTDCGTLTAFRSYEGPITDFTRMCFACGDKPKYGMRIGLLVRVLGVCPKHLALAQSMQKQAAEKNQTPPIHGIPKPPPRRKSVFEAIAEAEAYFAEQEGDEKDE